MKDPPSSCPHRTSKGRSRTVLGISVLHRAKDPDIRCVLLAVPRGFADFLTDDVIIMLDRGNRRVCGCLHMLVWVCGWCTENSNCVDVGVCGSVYQRQSTVIF